MNRAALLLACGLLAVAGPAAAYDAVRIVAPPQESTVHDNNGDVAVQVETSPVVDPLSGDRIELLLDGNPVGLQSGDRFELTGVLRGAHTLQARIESADGATIAASAPATFYMWRASRLFPGRRP